MFSSVFLSLIFLRVNAFYPKIYHKKVILSPRFYGVSSLGNFNSNFEDKSKFSFLTIQIESLLYNHTKSTFLKYLSDYKDDSSREWFHRFASDNSDMLWSKFLEKMITSNPEIVSIRRKSPTVLYGNKDRLSNNTAIEHSRQVDPKNIAIRLLAIRDDIVRELKEDVIISQDSYINNKKKISESPKNPANNLPNTPFRPIGSTSLAIELLLFTISATKAALRPSSTIDYQGITSSLNDQIFLIQDIQTDAAKKRSRFQLHEEISATPSELEALSLWKYLVKMASQEASVVDDSDVASSDDLSSHFAEFYSACRNLPALSRVLFAVASEVRDCAKFALEEMSTDTPLFLTMIDRLGGCSLRPGPPLSRPPPQDSSEFDSDTGSFRIFSLEPEDTLRTNQPTVTLMDSDTDVDADLPQAASSSAGGSISETNSGKSNNGPATAGSRQELAITESPSLFTRTFARDSPSLQIAPIEASPTGATTGGSSSTGSQGNDTMGAAAAVAPDADSPVSAGGMRGLSEDPFDGESFAGVEEGRRRVGWRVYDRPGSGENGRGADDNVDKETAPDTDGAGKRQTKLLEPPPSIPEPPSGGYNGPVDDEGGRGGPVDRDDTPRGTVEEIFEILGPNILIRVVGSMSESNQFGSGSDLDPNSEPNNSSGKTPDYLCLEAVSREGYKVRRWVRYSNAVDLLDSSISESGSKDGSLTSAEDLEEDPTTNNPFLGGGLPMM